MNVVAPVFTMRFTAKAVGGMVPAAVVTKGVAVAGSHWGAVTVPPHCKMVPTVLGGNPVPVTVTICPSARPVDGLAVRVTPGSVPVYGVSAKAGSTRLSNTRAKPPILRRRHPTLIPVNPVNPVPAAICVSPRPIKRTGSGAVA